MNEDLLQHLREMEARIERQLAELSTKSLERMEEIETRLLRAFHPWARNTDIRMRGVATLATTFDERLGSVEERLSDLERKSWGKP